MNVRLITAAGLVATATAAAVALPPLPVSAQSDDELAEARRSTAAYHNSRVVTQDAAWAQLYDKNGVTCIDSPAGGMGIHFVNPSRIGDPGVVAGEPEAVIYEPQKNGRLRLVAVEYVVTRQAWEEAGNTAPPTLFGEVFTLVPAGNRYGLPDFYELHAWIWKHNPKGMHDDWNPAVSCEHA